MNKKVLGIVIIVVSALLVGLSLYDFITSFSYYADEYGTDISFSNDSVVLLFTAIAFLWYGIYAFIRENKGLNVPLNTSFAVFGTATFVNTLYNFGVFFKALTKALGKGKPFDFGANASYLVYGFIFLVAFVAITYIYNKFRTKKA